MLDGIKDKALDFLLEYLPKMKIPKIEGRKEEYSVNYTVWDEWYSSQSLLTHVLIPMGNSSSSWRISTCQAFWSRRRMLTWSSISFLGRCSIPFWCDICSPLISGDWHGVSAFIIQHTRGFTQSIFFSFPQHTLESQHGEKRNDCLLYWNGCFVVRLHGSTREHHFRESQAEVTPTVSVRICHSLPLSKVSASLNSNFVFQSE